MCVYTPRTMKMKPPILAEKNIKNLCQSVKSAVIFEGGKTIMETVRQAIQTGNENFMTAFNQGDAARVAALYTTDARLLPPNSQMITGTENIQAFWQGAMNMGIKEARLETVELELRDDMAVEIGKYTLTIQPEGGESLTDEGKYVVAWKNDNGTWKLHIDIWNTSRPA